MEVEVKEGKVEVKVKEVKVKEVKVKEVKVKVSCYMWGKSSLLGGLGGIVPTGQANQAFRTSFPTQSE